MRVPVVIYGELNVVIKPKPRCLPPHAYKLGNSARNPAHLWGPSSTLTKNRMQTTPATALTRSVFLDALTCPPTLMPDSSPLSGHPRVPN